MASVLGIVIMARGMYFILRGHQSVVRPFSVYMLASGVYEEHGGSCQRPSESLAWHVPSPSCRFHIMGSSYHDDGGPRDDTYIYIYIYFYIRILVLDSGSKAHDMGGFVLWPDIRTAIES